MSSLQIHVVSTGKQTFQQLGDIAKDIDPYVDVFHIREKSKTAKELQDGIETLLRSGIAPSKIFVNDRVDVAWAMDLGGVQLAYHSLDVDRVKERFPGLKVGTSVHSVSEAIEKANAGSDYIVFGHIFETQSKPGLEAKGTDVLRKVVQHVQIPVIAIGGIKPSNVTQVMKTGVAGVAIMSGILEAADPKKEIELYRTAICKGDV
jgi:thiazole tautomerase (transcriptional regulator TenI)